MFKIIGYHPHTKKRAEVISNKKNIIKAKEEFCKAYPNYIITWSIPQ